MRTVKMLGLPLTFPMPEMMLNKSSNGTTITTIITTTTTRAKSEQSLDSLQQLCEQLNEKISAFLQAEPETELVRRVQCQTAISLQTVHDALERYSSVPPPAGAPRYPN